MHDGEIATDVSLVDELVRTQFPRWHGLPITQVRHGGTDHAIYRLGDDLAVRLPRIAWAGAQPERDAATLPRLAPHLPVAVPETLAVGEPDLGYPHRWSVVRWLPGDIATIDAVRPDTGIRLAELIQALHGIDATGEPWTTYRGRLDQSASDDAIRRSIAELGGNQRLVALWEEALAAPRWDQPARWLHADLHAGNLLFTDGELTGVIDWGCAAAGDPAGDLMTAWLFLDERGRKAFQRELTFDDATWARARGWALHLAGLALPYYQGTNPFLVSVARHTLDQLCPGWEN
jgi:aminoglycoside phosphotransferase (APT) family kinase protein